LLLVLLGALGAAGFAFLCRTSFQYLTDEAPRAAQHERDNNRFTGLDVLVTEQVRVPRESIVREVRIGRLAVGKKKAGFIRLGSFNEIRLENVDIVVSPEFFNPEPPALGHMTAGHPANDEGLQSLQALKALAYEYIRKDRQNGEKISFFSIRGLRIISQDRSGKEAVVVTAQRAGISDDSISLGPQGDVGLQPLWGAPSIHCHQATITFAYPATVRIPEASVHTSTAIAKHADLSLPLAALASRDAWEECFANREATE